MAHFVKIVGACGEYPCTEIATHRVFSGVYGQCGDVCEAHAKQRRDYYTELERKGHEPAGDFAEGLLDEDLDLVRGPYPGDEDEEDCRG